jgi:hypothetical protein
MLQDVVFILSGETRGNGQQKAALEQTVTVSERAGSLGV